MNVERALRATGKASLIAVLVIAVFGLAFRSLVWASWGPHEGDPYGASDILELLIFCLVFISGGICALAGIGLLFIRPRTFRFLVAGAVTPVAYALLHGFVPVFSLG